MELNFQFLTLAKFRNGQHVSLTAGSFSKLPAIFQGGEKMDLGNRVVPRRTFLRFATCVAGASFTASLKASDVDVSRAAARVRQIIAHRGASAERPECTAVALNRAIEAGATAVEVDVRTSADGQLFILHDETLDRTTNGKGLATRLTLDQLQRLDAGSWFGATYRGERIPSLVEAAEICRGRIDLLLDLKEQGDEYDRRVVSTVLQHGDPAKTIVGVRSEHQAKRFRQLMPEARQLGLIPTLESMDSFADAGVETIRLWPRWLQDGDAPVKRVHALKKLLLLNGTLGEETETRQLLQFEPDSLSSDHPARLKATLERIALGKPLSLAR